MDRSEAFRLLSDVVNLQHRVATAEEVVAGTTEKIDRARQRLQDAEASAAKAKAQVATTRDRLEAARVAAARIPPELAESLAEEIGAKRAARDRALEAMATVDHRDAEQVAAVRQAAADAGIVMAHAGSATASGEGNGV